MRWILLDRFCEIERDKRAVADKNISLQETCLQDQLPGRPIYPQTLMLEAMAQTGGVLAGYSMDFKCDLFLAKIESVVFKEPVWAPAKIVYTAELGTYNDTGCRFQAATTVDNKQVAQAAYLLVTAPADITGNTEPIVFNFQFFKLFNLQKLLGGERLSK